MNQYCVKVRPLKLRINRLLKRPADKTFYGIRITYQTTATLTQAMINGYSNRGRY